MFIDSANLDEIREGFSLGLLKGVTTNPSILLKEGKRRGVIVKEILDNSEGIVFVQATGSSYEEIYADCQEILAYGNKRIALKIPANIPGFQVINRLKNQNNAPIILATAIFSVDQSLLCGLAGCDYIAPYVNRMANNNINPYEVVNKTRKIYDDRGFSTKILAASFKNTNQVVDIFTAGAHTATVSSDVLRSMASKELASASISGFNRDWYELQSRLEFVKE
ncbi:transaldolase family protein [Niallia oryzisoli]|uniref:transaldolase family protein n=1 Tax=Niallia oryzisoli TaxID=1737571 RepID=UPI0037368F23